MLKVFLVEDEIVIREGIKNSIGWRDEGFDFVGDASDGELAFPMIQQMKPDILITDIKMPFTNGLELSRLVKKEIPNVKIIILSGYNEFEYAKEAINIGVTGYLLKPISSEKLLLEVKKVAKKIEEEREQKDYLNQFKQEMLENLNIAKQKFFNELIFKELSLSEILDKANKLEMNLIANFYNIVLLKVMVSGETATCYSNDVIEITEKVQQLIASQNDIFMFDRGAEGWAFLIKGISLDHIDQIVNDVIGEVVENIMQHHSLEFFGGSGKCVKRLSELPQSYDKANQAFSYRYMGKANQIVSYHQIEDNKGIDVQDIQFSMRGVNKVDRKILENFLKTGTINDVHKFVADYFFECKDNMQSIILRQYIVMDMYLCTVSFLEELGYSEEDIVSKSGGTLQITEIITSIDNARNFIETIVTETLRARDSASEKKYEKLLQQAKNYINVSYAKDDICLNQVAASVNISPSYFSSIFSQEVGMTFIEYLTQVRMNKAKELLMCTNMKTSEVGYEIGYKDPHYFSYLFKKTHNSTPKEFRARGKNKSEK